MAQRLLLAVKIITDLLLTHVRTLREEEGISRFSLLPSKVKHGSGFDKRATPGDVKLKISSLTFPTTTPLSQPHALSTFAHAEVRGWRGRERERKFWSAAQSGGGRGVEASAHFATRSGENAVCLPDSETPQPPPTARSGRARSRTRVSGARLSWDILGRLTR